MACRVLGGPWLGIKLCRSRGCRRRHRILMRGRPEGLCGELKLWPLHSSIRPAGPWAAGVELKALLRATTGP